MGKVATNMILKDLTLDFRTLGPYKKPVVINSKVGPVSNGTYLSRKPTPDVTRSPEEAQRIPGYSCLK